MNLPLFTTLFLIASTSCTSYQPLEPVPVKDAAADQGTDASATDRCLALYAEFLDWWERHGSCRSDRECSWSPVTCINAVCGFPVNQSETDEFATLFFLPWYRLRCGELAKCSPCKSSDKPASIACINGKCRDALP